MFALDPNVAGQSAQPFWRETAPHHQTHERRDHANDHNEFPQFAHTCSSHKEHKGNNGHAENKSAALVTFVAVVRQTIARTAQTHNVA